MNSMNLKAAHLAFGSFHWVIDGEPVTTFAQVFARCRNRGYDGTLRNLQQRLTNGMDTWAELSRPIDKKKSAVRKIVAARKKSEMHDICAELDARKKALAAKGEEE